MKHGKENTAYKRTSPRPSQQRCPPRRYHHERRDAAGKHSRFSHFFQLRERGRRDSRGRRNFPARCNLQEHWQAIRHV